MASKLIPHPGYTTSKKLLPPIRNMIREAGAQDACIQLQELSIEYLYNSAAATKAPIGEFLKLLYRSNSISHGTHDFSELREVASRSYLTATYALLEKMLRGIISEYKNKNPGVAAKWKTQNSDKENYAPLQELIENLPPVLSAPLKTAPEYKLLEYYRLVRVASSHRKDKTFEKAEKAHAGIKPSEIAHFEKYEPAMMAPSAPGSICFTDFMLFTRALKYYSKLLNEACA